MQTKIKCYAGCPRISVSRGSSSDGRRYSSWKAQAPSSSKNVGPSIELVKGFAFSDFSGRTDNVFLSKMDVLRLLPTTTTAVWTAASGRSLMNLTG